MPVEMVELKSVMYFELSEATVSKEAADEVRYRIENSDISFGCADQMTLVSLVFLFESLSCEEFFKPSIFRAAGLHMDGIMIHIEG